MFTIIKQFFQYFTLNEEGSYITCNEYLTLLYLKDQIKLNILNWDIMKPSDNSFLPLYQLPKKIDFSNTLHSSRIYHIDM